MPKPTSNRRFPYAPDTNEGSFYELKTRENAWTGSTIQLEAFPDPERRNRPNEHFMNIGFSDGLTEIVNVEEANRWGQPKHIDTNYREGQFNWISLDRQGVEELIVVLTYALQTGRFDK